MAGVGNCLQRLNAVVTKGAGPQATKRGQMAGVPKGDAHWCGIAPCSREIIHNRGGVKRLVPGVGAVEISTTLQLLLFFEQLTSRR